MPCYRDTVGIDLPERLQKRQGSETVVEMIRGHPDEIQVVSSLLSLRALFALSQVADEGSLVCRDAFPAAKREQEHVAVLREHGPEYLCGGGDRKRRRMLLRAVAATMVEQHGRKGPRSGRLPKVRL
jgi:hypothetical protein